MSEKKNTFLQVADAIKAEKRAWCKDTWYEQGAEGTPEETKVISRCLVDHLDHVTGVYYVAGFKKKTAGTGLGKYHYYEAIVKKSKDKRRWAKRNKLVAQLASLIDGGSVDGHYEEPNDFEVKSKVGRVDNRAVMTVTDWNDDSDRERKDVLKVLRRAAATYPNA